MKLIQWFLDHMGDGLSILNKDLQYLYVNKTVLDRRDSKLEDFLGKSLMNIHLNLQSSDRIKGYRKVLETGEPIVFELAASDDNTRFFKITAFKLGDNLGILTQDLTRDISFENTILELLRHADQLQYANILEQVYALTIDVMNSVLGFGYYDILIREGDMLKQVAAQNLPIGDGVPLDSNGVTIRALTTKKTIRVDDLRLDDDYYIMINPETGKYFEEYALSRSELATPIIVDDIAIGVLNVEHPEPNKFNDRDAVLLELLAIHIAGAIKRLNDLQAYLKAQEIIIAEQVELKRAKEMDAIKTRFISTATHEIRTPLTSIKGYTEILCDILQDTDDENVLTYFGTITRNLERLELLTNDLIDVQRIDSGKMRINIKPTDINELVEDVHLEVLPLINEKHQIIEILSQLHTEQIPMDRMRIHQILINLITNASRYSPEETKITINITESPTHITFKVTDRGRGIEPENLPKLFKAFPDIIYSDIQRGTGLGLAICRGIIELHKGKIWAESEGYGKGSTFTFTLPKN